MGRIVVTGGSGSVGRRVCSLLGADDSLTVVAVDRSGTSTARGVDAVGLDLLVDDLVAVFDEAETVVHLATSFDPQHDDLVAARTDLEATRRVLDAVGATGVKRVVLVSSAMVYGAWPDNPVPITESAPLRPNPEFAFAVYKAEVERMTADWRSDHPGTDVVVLRPTTALAEAETSWVARTLRSAAILDAGETDPPVQFLHLDDLASAVVLAATDGMVGAYNVAPDSFVDGEACRELSGRVPRVRLRENTARRVAGFGWRHRLTPAPPGIVPYTMHAWVVANDRLRAAGWEPTSTNEEAYVAGTPAKPWATMNARRRQQLALGGMAVLTAGLALVAFTIVRWLRNR